MMKHALALAIAFAIVTPPAAAWAGFEAPNRLAAPFSPNATIYRPDCTIKDASVVVVIAPPRTAPPLSTHGLIALFKFNVPLVLLSVPLK